MKYKFYFSVVVVLLLIQFSSCKKCVDCSYPGAPSQRICKPYWDDAKAWQQKLDAYTDNGGSCS